MAILSQKKYLILLHENALEDIDVQREEEDQLINERIFWFMIFSGSKLFFEGYINFNLTPDLLIPKWIVDRILITNCNF